MIFFLFLAIFGLLMRAFFSFTRFLTLNYIFLTKFFAHIIIYCLILKFPLLSLQLFLVPSPWSSSSYFHLNFSPFLLPSPILNFLSTILYIISPFGLLALFPFFLFLMRFPLLFLFLFPLLFFQFV